MDVTSAKPTITAIILTKDEEKNIERCLKHLLWIDDIVIVDSGSRDSTLEIARKYNCRIFINIPEKYYAADQRNWALRNTGIKTEWVIFVDADEVITEELKNEIIKKLSSAPANVVGFRLAPKFMFMEKWLKYTCNYPVWHDRILRTGKVFFDENKKFWECFKTDGDIDKIEEPYLHYGFNNGIRQWLQKHINYAEWRAEEFIQLRNLSLRDIAKIKGRKAVVEMLSLKLGVISPVFRFIYHFIIKKGFLDGFPGMIYSLLMSTYQFFVYLFILEKNKSL